jgi:8-oxo-dGTP diphosphatase
MSDGRIRTVSAFLHNPEGKVIAHLRDDKPDILYPACWSTLGGRVEDGETPDEAMQRELIEEIEICPPLTFWRMFDHCFEVGDMRYEVDIYAYVGDIQLGASEIRLHEGQKVEFLSRDDIDRLPFAFGLDQLYRAFFTDYDGNTGRDL